MVTYLCAACHLYSYIQEQHDVPCPPGESLRIMVTYLCAACHMHAIMHRRSLTLLARQVSVNECWCSVLRGEVCVLTSEISMT